jgi:hypothetical protein
MQVRADAQAIMPQVHWDRSDPHERSEAVETGPEKVGRRPRQYAGGFPKAIPVSGPHCG